MGIRLYDSAWVKVENQELALQVRKDSKNPAAFNVGDYQYDIDGMPLKTSEGAPKIESLHSLQSAKEAGLRTEYNRDVDPAI
ncbi:MAG: hypothetical protein WBQ60_04400 [Asticcacaulis sp.]